MLMMLDTLMLLLHSPPPRNQDITLMAQGPQTCLHFTTCPGRVQCPAGTCCEPLPDACVPGSVREDRFLVL